MDKIEDVLDCVFTEPGKLCRMADMQFQKIFVAVRVHIFKVRVELRSSPPRSGFQELNPLQSFVHTRDGRGESTKL